MVLIGAILLAVFVLPFGWGIAAVAGAAALEVAEIFFWVWLSKRYSIQVGAETLVDARAVVVTPCRPTGQVRVQGELWQARCREGADPGETVRVLELDGLTLVVEREAAGDRN
jgi:membrane protein implicated in regulation of membrane protease activity